MGRRHSSAAVLVALGVWALAGCDNSSSVGSVALEAASALDRGDVALHELPEAIEVRRREGPLDHTFSAENAYFDALCPGDGAELLAAGHVDGALAYFILPLFPGIEAARTVKL